MMCTALIVVAFAAGAVIGGAAVYTLFVFAQSIADHAAAGFSEDTETV